MTLIHDDRQVSAARRNSRNAQGREGRRRRFLFPDLCAGRGAAKRLAIEQLPKSADPRQAETPVHCAIARTAERRYMSRAEAVRSLYSIPLPLCDSVEIILYAGERTSFQKQRVCFRN